MNHPIAISLLLTASVVVLAVCCLGMLVTRSAIARLHWVGPAAMAAPLGVAAAILVQEGFSQAGTKAILIAVLLIVQSPLLAHIAGRAISVGEHKAYRGESHGKRS